MSGPAHRRALVTHRRRRMKMTSPPAVILRTTFIRDRGMKMTKGVRQDPCLIVGATMFWNIEDCYKGVFHFDLVIPYSISL